MLAQKKNKSRKRKSEAVGESKQKKKSKEAKKKKVVELGTYSEHSGRGTSLKPSSDKLASEHIDTMQSSELPISSPTPNSKSTKIQTQISSSISHTTKSTQAQTSFVTYSESNSETSSESSSQDPPSPSTVKLSKLKTSTSAQINTLPPVLNQIDSDTPMTEPSYIALNNSGSEPNTSEIPISEPLISELTTQPIPLAHLDNSGNEVLISDKIPMVTLPSENSPSSAIILHQPIPNNLEEYINLFGYNALRQIQDLRTNTCPNPALVKRNWEEFRRWLNQSFQRMDFLAETAKKTEILAAAERRIQYENELATKLAQRKRAEAERAALEAAAKAEFLKDQAEIEQVMLEREELERA